jgi:plasmid stability protein
MAIELPENELMALQAKARARGVSLEEYARQVLEHDLSEENTAEPFWKTFTRRMHAVPAEVFERENRRQPGNDFNGSRDSRSTRCHNAARAIG